MLFFHILNVSHVDKVTVMCNDHLIKRFSLSVLPSAKDYMTGFYWMILKCAGNFKLFSPEGHLL